MTAIKTSIKTLALTFVIVLVATASPAVAADEVLSIDSASLVARGAAVDVTYSFVCDADSEVFTPVRLAQRSGRGVAIGFGSPAGNSVQCTGETQTITVRVIAEGGPAFKKGVAVVTVGLVRCTFEGPVEGPVEGPGEDPCTFSELSEVLRITR